MSLPRRFGAALLAVLFPLALHAQKKALTQADWDRWRSIQTPTLSNDGNWVAYRLAPQVGDGELVVRSTSGSTEYRIPLGYVSRPNNVPGGAAPAGGGRGGAGGGAGAAGTIGPFTIDNRWVLTTTQPNKEAVDRTAAAARARAAAGRGGGGAAATGGAAAAADTTNRTSLVMLSLADGKMTTLENVRSFRLPRESARWMIYAPGDTAGTSRAAGDTAGRGGAAGAGGRAGGGGRGGRGGGAAPGGPRRSYGSAIVLRDMTSGTDEKMTDVLAYTFDDSAKVLAYTVVSHDSTKDGMFVRNLATGKTRTVLTGPGNYRGFTFDRKQQQFVFLSDRDDFGKPDAQSKIYYGSLKDTLVQALVTGAALPDGMRLPESATASFTRAGNALLLNIASPPEDTIPADSLSGKAKFDLWHWQDPQLQPQQLLSVARDRNRTYQALFNLTAKKVVRLTTDSMPSISLTDDGTKGVLSTSIPYNIQSMWGDNGNDIYAVDVVTGVRKLIRQKISGSATLSVDGKYIAFYDAGHWYSYAFATGKTTDISSAAKGVHFEQETWSTPDTPSAWGIAGWTKGDRSVLIYDRFDVWEIDPLGGRPPVVITDSVGRREQLTFRLVDLQRDREEDRWIDPAKPLYFRVFSEVTKASGFYKDQLGVVRAPEKMAYGDLNFGTPTKAKNAEVYLLTKSSFVDFPNLWVGPNLTTLTRISDANPWQQEYNWGTVELVNWLSADGVPLQGLLYKPENFDPAKKYPMISYFYEDLSDGLHTYVPPNGRNVINPTHYVSNGYLVFEPDIHYEIGYPGPSAIKSIVPGVQMLLQRGYVNPKGLGLQGQSWGGYQIAYMITQTGLFSAAMAGAPVSNMTSAYGGIRWGSGLARSFQYEKSQSRLGKSLWEGQQLYIENSPIFWLDRITTPLFIMSNDADDAVPWYQGIEMFVGMRRLGKEVYLINYNNDVHNPASRANQKDIAMRMQQFFDNKLMGKPAPDWMVHGIPAKDKGKSQVNWAAKAPAPTTAPATTGGKSGGGGTR